MSGRGYALAMTDASPWSAARRLLLPAAALTVANVIAGRLITGPLRGLPTETAAIEALQARRTPVRDRIARAVSTTSDVPASVALAVASIPLLRVRGRSWPQSVVPALAMGLETVVYLAAGAAVSRERPPVERLDHDQPTSSFPSGHVGATVALLTVAWAAAGRIESPGGRAAARAACLAYPSVLAPARVYVGMHYPSDVVVGVLNGLACGAMALRYEREVSPGRPS